VSIKDRQLRDGFPRQWQFHDVTKSQIGILSDPSTELCQDPEPPPLCRVHEAGMLDCIMEVEDSGAGDEHIRQSSNENVEGSIDAKRLLSKRRSIKFEDESTQSARTLVGRLWARLENVLEWWSCLEEPPCDSRMYRFVHHLWFESVSATAIALNTSFAIYTTNYHIEHASEDDPRVSLHPWSWRPSASMV